MSIISKKFAISVGNRLYTGSIPKYDSWMINRAFRNCTFPRFIRNIPYNFCIKFVYKK